MEVTLQNHNYDCSTNDNISNLIGRPLYTTQNDSQEYNYNQQVPKPISQYVVFNDKRKQKELTNRQFTKNQAHYFEDEDYFHQYQQHYNTNQRKNHCNDKDQPDDIFDQKLFNVKRISNNQDNAATKKNLAQLRYIATKILYK